ncbi:MAG: CBS domain-containing protein [Bacteriovoracaceae bacterium]|nr:CBS domain-containing protein [Bacteriovoracaceae bacterium]
MGFFIAINGELKEHDFEYLVDLHSLRVEKTLPSNIPKNVKDNILKKREENAHRHYASEVMNGPPRFLTSDSKLLDATDLMRIYEIRHVPIVENSILVGMLSDRDLLRLESKVDFENVILKDVMTTLIVAADHNTSLRSIALVMYKENISGMPVTKDKSLVGMITRTDILKMVIENKFSY